MSVAPDGPQGNGLRECVDPEATASLPNGRQGETPALDIERYRPYLDGMNLSDEQATELLLALWSILSTFVDLAFGVDSVHLARPQPKEGSTETDAAADNTLSAHQPGHPVAKDMES